MNRVDRTLGVDLDGTLIRTDMLFETFWAGFSKSWATPWLVLPSLLRGRAAFKRRLSTITPVETALLPYNPDVIAYVEHWRANGGRTALVTASDQKLADNVAAYLGLFDEAHGSDGLRNLKGEAKAHLLIERFGEGQFDYIGDSPVDLPVWAKSAKAITINAPRELRAKVDMLGRETEHLESSSAGIKPYIEALRPHQWLKNTLVFVPIIAAHAVSPEMFLQTALAFVAFSLIASSVYILNDLLDLSADRAHPRKRLRPFASGDIPIAHGTLMAPVLLLLGLICALPLGWLFLLVMLAYFAATSIYSLSLKRRMVIDICMLAGLYTMRIFAGGAATGIPLSVWLLAFSLFFFFSLAAVKRYAELVDGVASGQIRAHGRGYHVDDLPLVSTMILSSGYVSVLVMALYLNSPDVAQLYSNPSALWGICVVLFYWITRTAMVTHRGAMHDDPIVFAIKDRISQLCLVIVVGFAIAGVVL